MSLPNGEKSRVTPFKPALVIALASTEIEEGLQLNLCLN